ncbi:MAG: hypothetical protein L7U87_02645 [Chlamydiales bacterium]|nr:hypothetical protein [Chlamydiales bacterium]
MYEHSNSKFSIPKFLKLLIIGLLVSTILCSCESSSIIINGVDEREANEILVTLYTANIPAEKLEATGKEIAWNISVPKSKKIAALAILTRRGFPRSKRDSILQIINRSSGLVPSDTTEELKFREGKARQIENTILKMDGIIDASVEISYPKDDPLNPGKKKADLTASVYVKLEGPLDPNNQLVSRIKRLVSSSINGLEFENVTVITDQTRLSDYSTMSKNNSNVKAATGLVKIWSITIAKESQSMFQVLFFSFLSIILVLLLGSGFLIWKFFALLRSSPKGLRSLFSLAPLTLIDLTGEVLEEKDDGEEGDEEEDEDDEDEDDDEDFEDEDFEEDEEASEKPS